MDDGRRLSGKSRRANRGCRIFPAERARLSDFSCQEVDVLPKQIDVVQRQEEKTGSTQDQRRAENRAIAAAAIPTFPPSQDQDQNPPAAAEQQDAESPKHDNCDCVEGLLYRQNSKGNTVMVRCQRWLAWAKWEKAEHVRRETEEQAARNAVIFKPFVFGDILAGPSASRPQLPAGDTFDDVFRPSAHVRTIEVEWTESKPAAQLSGGSSLKRRPAQRNAGDILPPKMYADCWKWIMVSTTPKSAGRGTWDGTCHQLPSTPARME
jgi:hypothetical protein